MKREEVDELIIAELARRELERLRPTLHPMTDEAGLLEGLQRLIKYEAQQKNLLLQQLD